MAASSVLAAMHNHFGNGPAGGWVPLSLQQDRQTLHGSMSAPNQRSIYNKEDA
jgi:hypothetical protein